METSTKEDFWAELDRIGPDEVRARLAIKYYSDLTEKGPLAREWLRRMDQTAADRPERSKIASNLEQIRMNPKREKRCMGRRDHGGNCGDRCDHFCHLYLPEKVIASVSVPGVKPKRQERANVGFVHMKRK
jgi:hypothetical protein